MQAQSLSHVISSLKHKSIFFTLLLLSAFTFLNAQQHSSSEAKETLKARGIIQNSETLQPVPFATLSVTCHYDTLPADTLYQVSDDAGRFEMALPIAERYTFSPSFVGLKANATELTAAQLRSRGLVRLAMVKDNTLLDEVVVVAQKPVVRLGIDRIAYNVKDDPMNKALSLHEMMRRVPLVTIDGEGNLQVKGTTDFAIYLNGRPSSFISANPKEVLKSIPASSVQNIEVITNPGVEYDATGASVIINIVTQKGLDLKGILGAVSLTSLAHNGFTWASNLTTAFGKASLTANYQGMEYWMKKKWGTFIDSESSTAVGFRKGTIYTDDMKFRSHNLNVNFNYEFDKKNLLSTAFVWSNQSTPPFNGYSDIYNYLPEDHSNALSREYAITNKSINNNNFELRADYQHDFERENEKLILSYLFVRNPVRNTDSLYVDLTHQADRLFSGLLISSSLAKLDEHTWQADYTLPISQQHKISTGAKYIYRRGSSNPHYQTDGNGSTVLAYFGVADTLAMRYRQQVFAAYLKYTLSLEKLSGSAGVRLETGNQKVHHAENFLRKFTDVVPEVGISYSFTPKLQLKANYNLHVRRPSILQLNPYTTVMGSVLIQRGNSNLLNEKLHSIELSLGSYGQKLTLQSSLEASYTQNPIATTYVQDPDDRGRMISTFENIGFSRSVGGNFFVRYVPLSWFNTMINGGVKWSEFDAGKLINSRTGKEYWRNNKGWTGQLFAMVNFILPKKWTIVAYGGIFSQPLSLAQDAFFGSYHGMNIVKTFLDGKLTIAGNINNPFMKYYRFRIHSFGEDFESNVLVKRRALQVSFTVSYTFGELKSAIKKVSKTIENTDVSTVKEGNAQGSQGIGGNQ